jgi:hypothetical protein
MFVLSFGIGYFPVVCLNIVFTFSILFMSASLTESLELAAYHWNDINATVARTARIVITTMSSTSVKALFFLVVFIVWRNLKILYIYYKNNILFTIYFFAP